MTYQRYKMVQFGLGRAGLVTVGFTVLNGDGTVAVARTTAGVVERPAGSGTYGALITFPSGQQGELRWDSGQTPAVYASEPVNPGSDEYLSGNVGVPVGASIAADIAEVAAETDLLSTAFGSGTVPVDHNYGGTNALAYVTAAGAGIIGATVTAYSRANYDAGRRSSADAAGSTATVVGGGWAHPIMLDPGNYTLIMYKTGLFGPDRVDLTVT